MYAFYMCFLARNLSGVRHLYFMQRLEQDELSLIQSLQSSTGNEDLFVQATNHAIDDLDTQSASSVERSTIGRSRTLDTSEAEMTKLEKVNVTLFTCYVELFSVALCLARFSMWHILSYQVLCLILFTCL